MFVREYIYMGRIFTRITLYTRPNGTKIYSVTTVSSAVYLQAVQCRMSNCNCYIPLYLSINYGLKI